MSEGDIIAIFSQFGEPVYLNLIRDKDTGKSKGFAFLKYEDQRSTDLAVDNLGGTTVLGRMLKVDHTRYSPKEDEDTKDNTTDAAGMKNGDESQEDSEDGRRVRKELRYNKHVDKDTRRQILEEEMELQALVIEHDEDDPMKEYLINQKREQVHEAKIQASKGAHNREGRERRRHRNRRHHSRQADAREVGDRPHRNHGGNRRTERRHRSYSR